MRRFLIITVFVFICIISGGTKVYAMNQVPTEIGFFFSEMRQIEIEWKNTEMKYAIEFYNENNEITAITSVTSLSMMLLEVSI